MGIDLTPTPTGLTGPCPIPSHPGDNDNNRAFTYQADRGIWSCWTHECHRKYGNDIIGFIRAYYQTDFQSACRTLANILGQTVDFSKVDQQERYKQEVRNLLLRDQQEQCRILDETQLMVMTYNHDYMVNRGFDPEFLCQEQIGYFKGYPRSFMRNRIIFPVRNFDGRLIGYTGRSVMDDEQIHTMGTPKWLHSADLHQYQRFPKLSVLYNVHDARKYLDNKILFLVEGTVDVLRMKSAGFRNVCAVLGSDLGKNQARMVRRAGARHVVPLFDGDTAGLQARQRVHNIFSDGDVITVGDVVLPEDRDPGDLTIAELRELLYEFI